MKTTSLIPSGTRGLLLVALLAFCGPVAAQLKLPAQKPAPSAPRQEARPAAEPEGSSAEKVVQEIANCVLSGAPQGWRTAGVEVNELDNDGKERKFEARYFVVGADGVRKDLVPCDAREPAMNVYRLNSALEPDKRDWIKATLSFSSEGKFELKYDYPKKD
ncbi:MAG: hypothetical protein IPK29_18555 [Betaproteobacteria bacterium]|nr:hypothetical protein [Betaproteobacteria bacterium]